MSAKKPPQIIPIDEWDESINILIYGDSGAGKTVFAASSPNVLMLAIENGVISAKRQGLAADVWPINSWEDLVSAYEWLYDNPGHGYEWVVIDSLTDMQEKGLRSILKHAHEESKGKRDLDIPAIQDHQKWQNSMKRMVDGFNDLPVNVLYTALAMHKEDEEGEDLILPLILGKDYAISQALCGKMQAVGYLGQKVSGEGDTRSVEHRILFEHIKPYFAKDRYGCLGRFLTIRKDGEQVNDMNSVIKLIEESGDTRRSNSPGKKGKRVETAKSSAPAKKAKPASKTRMVIEPD